MVFSDSGACKGWKLITVIEFLALLTDQMVMPFAEMEKGVGEEIIMF